MSAVLYRECHGFVLPNNATLRVAYPRDVSVSSLFGKQPRKHIEYCNSFLCGCEWADGLQSAKPYFHRASEYRTSKDVYELETSKLSLTSDRCALTRYHTGDVQRVTITPCV